MGRCGGVSAQPGACPREGVGRQGLFSADAQQLTEPQNLPVSGLSEQTLRQVVRLSVGGPRLRVHLSNEFGDRPLEIRAARIARSAGGDAVDHQGDRPLAFGGQASVTLPAGADMAFVATLEELGPERVHLHFDDEADGKFLDIVAAIAAAPANAHFYCCGPNPMLKAFEAAAASRPRPNVHVEYFTPKEETKADELGGFWVEVADEFGRALKVREKDRDLLALALERTAGGEDLLRQIGRGIGEWCLARAPHGRRGG